MLIIGNGRLVTRSKTNPYLEDGAVVLDGTRACAYATVLDCIRDGVTTIFDHHASFGEIPGSLFAISDKTFEEMVKANGGMTGFHIHVAEGMNDVYDSLRSYGCRPVNRLLYNGILGEKTMLGHCIHISPSAPGISRSPWGCWSPARRRTSSSWTTSPSPPSAPPPAPTPSWPRTSSPPTPSTSRRGGPASCWPVSWAWAIPTALCSICRWATTWWASSPPRWTPTLRA